MSITLSSKEKCKVVLIPGDGIGREIMPAVETILIAANANIEFIYVQAGKIRDKNGNEVNAQTPEGEIKINEELSKTVELITRHKLVLKGPTTTPIGSGKKSDNVALRKGFGEFANVRNTQDFMPIIRTNFPGQNITIFRENEEGLYAAIEHQQTPNVIQALSYKSYMGMHRIITAAFEEAILHGRTKVTCLHKANILKKTEGEFQKMFNTVARNYPTYTVNPQNRSQIKAVGNLLNVPTDQWIEMVPDNNWIEVSAEIIDIGMARVATRPLNYQVIVTENLFGDILSDIASELTGSVGQSGSSNIGNNYALFEAIHGTADDIVGKDLANPCGLLQAAIDLLVYTKEPQNLYAATIIQDALLYTLSAGYLPKEIQVKKLLSDDFIGTPTYLGTKSFAEKIIEYIKILQQDIIIKDHKIIYKSLNIEEKLGALKNRHIDYLANYHQHLSYTGNKQDINYFVNRYKRTKPYITKSTQTTTDGADLFIEWTGLEKEVLEDYKTQTKIDLEQMFNSSIFQTIQELYDYAHWLKGALSELIIHHPNAINIKILDILKNTNLDISEILQNWGILFKPENSSTTELNLQYFSSKTIEQIINEISKVTENHQQLAISTSRILANKISQVIKDTGFKLTMMSNRGQSVYPTIMDVDLVDQFRCRFLATEEKFDIHNEKEMQIAIGNLIVKFAEVGIRVNQQLPLRTYTVTGQKSQKGYGPSYGEGWGQNVLSNTLSR